MALNSLKSVIAAMEENGVVRLYIKRLRQNDNQKQQIYLGTGFDALSRLPFRSLRQVGTAIHADVDFKWMCDHGLLGRAPLAKLICYPRYPEVRLSGFLRGCRAAPNLLMRPVAKSDRKPKSLDGRVLMLGVTAANEIVAYLAAAGSQLANEIAAKLPISDERMLHELAMPHGSAYALKEVLNALLDFKAMGATGGMKFGKGDTKSYSGQNAGGFTLEALFDIEANSKTGPDYKGWELKGFKGARITLLSSEPDGGSYFVSGLHTFLTRYGYGKAGGRWDFNGSHKANVPHSKTGLLLKLEGFDPASGKLDIIHGGLKLLDSGGACAASWSYVELMIHWTGKHNQAVYVAYIASGGEYHFCGPAIVCRGTNFTKFLLALHQQAVQYDPGMRFDPAKAPPGKKRSQFRIGGNNLASLYDRVERISY